MRRLVVTMFLVVLLSFGTSLALAADINDVRQDHWAYESVKYLVDKGYIQLYDDSTFRGQETVDRYTLATVLYRILKELSAESIDIAQGDLELLRKLTVEFREELVALSLRSAEVESAFSELEKTIQVIWEDVALMTESTDLLREEMEDTIQGLRIELEAIRAAALDVKVETNALKSETESIRAETASVKAETGSLRSDLDVLTSDILANQSYVVEVKSEVEELKGSIDSLYSEIGASETKVIRLQESLDTLEGSLSTVEGKIVGLEDTVDKLGDTLSILDASLSNSLRRESELRRELTELNMAFDEYKQDTQKQIETLRMYVIIGVILGIVIR